jgi:hypothetical protein
MSHMQIAVNNVNIATGKLVAARDSVRTDGGEVALDIDEGHTQQTVDLAKMSRAFLTALMNTDLGRNQRAAVAAQLGDRETILEHVVCTPVQLGKLLKTLEVPGEPTVEIQLGGRWYPVPVMNVGDGTDRNWGQWCSLTAQAKVVDQLVGRNASWNNGDFVDDHGRQRKRTVRELLEEEGIRIASPESVAKQADKMVRTGQIGDKHGTVMAAKGSVLGINEFLWRTTLDAIPLGSGDRPRQIILEPELELRQGNQGFYGGYGHGGGQEFQLPLVRAFSLDLKKYVYADIDDITAWEFDGGAMDRLVLPDDMREILTQVFDASGDEIFGDLFKGRHGGMILLANGPQGVGKTLTAEVFAEHTRRPLYVLEMGELGTNLADVEKSLQRVFARAARWDAVLLFDEADVFLARRAEADLERSAIVGVFLRLLDRYEGMFFLTTNRAEVIDPAFRSRITLKLDYPQLSPGARLTVWENMLRAADVTVEGDMSIVAEEEIDGRQIRNQVRLLKVIHNGSTISAETVKKSLRFIARN